MSYQHWIAFTHDMKLLLPQAMLVMLSVESDLIHTFVCLDDASNATFGRKSLGWGFFIR